MIRSVVYVHQFKCNKKKERNVFSYFKKPIRYTQRKYSVDTTKKMCFICVNVGGLPVIVLKAMSTRSCPCIVSWHLVKQEPDRISDGDEQECGRLGETWLVSVCTYVSRGTGERQFVEKRATLSNGCEQSGGWQLRRNLLQSPPHCFTAAGNHGAAAP